MFHVENFKTTIKKEELLEKLRENLKMHRKIFLEAQEGYRKRIIEIFDERLREAREGRMVSHVIRLTEPEDHTEDYKTVISMLEMGTENEITLSGSQFANFVQDKWEWSDRFLTANALYSQTAMELRNE